MSDQIPPVLNISDEVKGFVDPYKDVPDELKWRICADVALKDHLLIKAICPFRGVIQVMTNILFRSVVDELRQRNITFYTEENYDELIRIVRRRAAPVTPQQEPSRNVPGGKGSVHPAPPHAANKQSSVKRGNRRGQPVKGSQAEVG